MSNSISSDPQHAPRDKRKRPRSHTGCHTCRARKVKCDNWLGTCANCERLGLTCVGRGLSVTAGQSSQASSQAASQAASQGTGHASQATKRKRTFESCINCRASRTRCSGDQPACQRCLQRMLQCVYEASSVPAWAQRMQRITSSRQTHTTHSHTLPASPSNPRRTQVSPSMRTVGSHAEQNERVAGASLDTADLSWLNSAHLPDIERIRMLVEFYFNNIHCLRSLGFVHKPSFMQRLDHEEEFVPQGNALIHIMCAFGALFYAVDHCDQVSSKFILSAGSHWANQTQSLILADLGKISVENLMAAVLLHDYRLRCGDFATAFMLSGITARMAQATQINLEYSTDVLCRDTDEAAPSQTARESRRRLMWSCYISDALVGSGVDQLTLLHEKDIKIQLPCNESKFRIQAPCITPTLEGGILSFLRDEPMAGNPEDNVGMAAYFIRYISTRKKVLRYIKHLDEAKLPWLPDSEFAILDAECRTWYAALPASMQFTPSAVYIRKETAQLGALVMLHLMYHETICDMYRIGAPALYKLRAAFKFPPEQQSFLVHLQDTLYDEAKTMSLLLEEAMRHGPKTLADSWLPSLAYDSCRIMLYYITQILDPTLESSKPVILEIIPRIQSNIRALKMMRPLHSIAGPLCKVAETMLDKASVGSHFVRQNVVPDDPYSDTPEDDERLNQSGPPAQSTPDYVLHPLSIFRMARKAVPEKHAPERRATSTQNVTSSRNIAATDLRRPPLLASDQVNPSAPAGLEPQAGFDELQFLLTSDLGWTWQPPETATGSGAHADSLPPWMSSFYSRGVADEGGGGVNLDYWYTGGFPQS